MMTPEQRKQMDEQSDADYREGWSHKEMWVRGAVAAYELRDVAMREAVAEAVKAERERCIALCETTIMGGKAREFLEPKQ